MYNIYFFYLKGDSGGPLHVRRSYGYLEVVGTYSSRKKEREREREREICSKFYDNFFIYLASYFSLSVNGNIHNEKSR